MFTVRSIFIDFSSCVILSVAEVGIIGPSVLAGSIVHVPEKSGWARAGVPHPAGTAAIAAASIQDANSRIVLLPPRCRVCPVPDSRGYFFFAAGFAADFAADFGASRRTLFCPS